MVFPIRRRLRKQINQQTRFDPVVIDSNYNALQNDQSIFKKLKRKDSEDLEGTSDENWEICAVFELKLGRIKSVEM
jgi:hypothetical protein